MIVCCTSWFAQLKFSAQTDRNHLRKAHLCAHCLHSPTLQWSQFFYVASILTRHITHWARLGCSGSMCRVIRFLPMQQFCTVMNKESTFHRPQSTTWLTLFFKIKVHISGLSFIVASPKHTCTTIILFFQHHHMAHLPCGWIHLAKEKHSLTWILTNCAQNLREISLFYAQSLKSCGKRLQTKHPSKTYWIDTVTNLQSM